MKRNAASHAGDGGGAWRPRFVLHSGRLHKRWARWTILAEPVAMLSHEAGRTQWRVLRDGPWVAAMPSLAHDALVDLERLAPAGPIGRDAIDSRGDGSCPPFAGGWIGYLSYDLGKRIEPKATHRRDSGGKEGVAVGGWPLWVWGYCPSAWVYDHRHRCWSRVGTEGTRSADVTADEAGENAPPSSWRFHHGGYRLGALTPSRPRGEIERAVRRAIDYIGAGDIFQANIAQRFTAPFGGDPRAIFAAAMERSPAWYGACLEIDEGRAIVSLSPELFLEVDPATRRVLTRPIKGTARSGESAALLAASEKDRAELSMIVDLMRNDLGRVCEYGSVKVSQARAIETHPTVHHGVATVEGTLRTGTSFVDLVRATFPGGSVTGAPKIRAIQIIDELEGFPRGPYCGAIGYVSASGHVGLSIAIRTLLIDGDEATYWTGAGIVADSDPAREYDEMLAKGAVVRDLVNDANARPVAPSSVMKEASNA